MADNSKVINCHQGVINLGELLAGTNVEISTVAYYDLEVNKNKTITIRLYDQNQRSILGAEFQAHWTVFNAAD